MYEEVDYHPRRKKDRRRWCGGREGREHQYGEWEKHGQFVLTYHTRRCGKCGRKEYLWAR